jgi:hypothetical protein
MSLKRASSCASALLGWVYKLENMTPPPTWGEGISVNVFRRRKKKIIIMKKKEEGR